MSFQWDYWNHGPSGANDMTPDTNAAPISDEDRARFIAWTQDNPVMVGRGNVLALDARLTAAEAERDEWKRAADPVALDIERQAIQAMHDELRAERDALREQANAACKLVADMHAAAVGEVRGATVGPVEDVAALRLSRDQARAAEARMRDLLRRHEWAYDEECIDLWCMECRAGRNQGHKPDCALARALDDHGRGEGSDDHA